MGFQINDISDGNPLGTIKIVEPDVWRGATHYENFDGYYQNFYINCAARTQIQQNHTHFNSSVNTPLGSEYNNPELHVYNSINEYCVNYNNKWYKPLSIVEMPTFDISKTDVIADHYENNNNLVSNTSMLNGGNNQHYGLYIKMLNFGGSQNGYSNQRLQYTQGDTYFQVNRNNNVGGEGILLWRIKTTANPQDGENITINSFTIQRNRFHLNPGKVVIFEST